MILIGPPETHVESSSACPSPSRAEEVPEDDSSASSTSEADGVALTETQMQRYADLIKLSKADLVQRWCSRFLSFVLSYFRPHIWFFIINSFDLDARS